MKINFLGIAGCIIIFLSIAFPWATEGVHGIFIKTDFASAVPYKGLTQTYLFTKVIIGDNYVKVFPIFEPPAWLCWTVLVFLTAGVILGFVGSLKMKNKLLACGGLSALFSSLLFLIVVRLTTDSDFFLGYHATGMSWEVYFDVGLGLSFIGSIILCLSPWLANLLTNKTSLQQPHAL